MGAGHCLPPAGRGARAGGRGRRNLAPVFGARGPLPTAGGGRARLPPIVQRLLLIGWLEAPPPPSPPAPRPPAQGHVSASQSPPHPKLWEPLPTLGVRDSPTLTLGHERIPLRWHCGLTGARRASWRRRPGGGCSGRCGRSPGAGGGLPRGQVPGKGERPEGTQAERRSGIHTRTRRTPAEGLSLLGPGPGRAGPGSWGPKPGPRRRGLQRPSARLCPPRAASSSSPPSLGLSFPSQPGCLGLLWGGERVLAESAPSGAPPRSGAGQESRPLERTGRQSVIQEFPGGAPLPFCCPCPAPSCLLPDPSTSDGLGGWRGGGAWELGVPLGTENFLFLLGGSARLGLGHDPVPGGLGRRGGASGATVRWTPPFLSLTPAFFREANRGGAGRSSPLLHRRMGRRKARPPRPSSLPETLGMNPGRRPGCANLLSGPPAASPTDWDTGETPAARAEGGPGGQGQE